MKDLVKIEKNKFKYLHIAVIILGSIFVSLSVFHCNLWFDESYSVGIANHSFKDIWIIGGSDVHPIFYYFALHVLNLIFGNNVLVYRLFSTLCTVLLGIMGFTHIRKDFGEKTGLIFSFLVFFFPVSLVYAGEIRMYSLAMLLVTLTAVYAYRIYIKAFKSCLRSADEQCSPLQDNAKDYSYIKNWVIFAVCSLAGAYTHYYALMASGLINLALLVGIVINFIKNRKILESLNTFEKPDAHCAPLHTLHCLLHDSNFRAFIVSGVIQVALYVPWLLSLLTQMGQVSQGFWIGIHFPDTIIELFTFQFTGNLGGANYVSIPIAIVWSLAITVYMIVLYLKDRKADVQCTPLQPNVNKDGSYVNNVNPAIIALILFLGVAIAACIVSLVIWRPIIYARYMLCVMGLFIFFLAYSMGTKMDSSHGRPLVAPTFRAVPSKSYKKWFKYMNLLVCITSMIMSLYININFINTNYDESNARPIAFVQEDIGDNDIILLNNHLNVFVIAVNFPENVAYFYDEENWNCEKAYRAFSTDFRTVYDLDFLEDFSGRVWVTNDSVLQQIQDKYDVNLIKHESFETEYRDYDFSISLVEK